MQTNATLYAATTAETALHGQTRGMPAAPLATVSTRAVVPQRAECNSDSKDNGPRPRRTNTSTSGYKKEEEEKERPALTNPDNVASILQTRYKREKEGAKRQTNPKKEETILVPPSTKDPQRPSKPPAPAIRQVSEHAT